MLGVVNVFGVTPVEKTLIVQVPVWCAVLKGSAEVFEITNAVSNPFAFITKGNRRLVGPGVPELDVVFQLILFQVAPELGGGQLAFAATI
jgi:hypothetical protein